MSRLKNCRRESQRGGAAVEFALVFPVLLVILWGMATTGSVLYAQLSLSRAAADGARVLGAVSGLTDYSTVPEAVKSTIRLEVVQSLALSLLSPGMQGGYEGRVAWMQQNILPNISVDNLSCGGGQPSTDVLRVRVAYPYERIRLLPQINLPLIGSMDAWMPDMLTGCAIARL